MKSKKAKAFLLPIGIIIFLAFVIGIAVGIFFLIPKPPQEAIGTTSVSYECPENHLCEAQAILHCTTITGEHSVVIFRTNAVEEDDYGDKDKEIWIAINGIPSGKNLIEIEDLRGYCKTGYKALGISTGRRTPTFNKIGVRNSKLFIEDPNGDWFEYIPCDLSEEQLSIIQQEPYTSNNQEVTSGTTQKYNCLAKEVTLRGESFETLSWINKANPTPEAGLRSQMA